MVAVSAKLGPYHKLKLTKDTMPSKKTAEYAQNADLGIPKRMGED